MRLCSILLASLGIALAAGCVPVRDNNLDPANAPAAKLAIVDTSPECAPAAGLPYETVVGTVSRGRCLALDARGSSDPQGGDDISSYRFELPAAGTYADRLVESATGLFPLEADYRRALPTSGGAISFGVRVRDGAGNYGDTTTDIKLSNGEPVAAIARGFSIRAGGLPWAPGTTIPVVFDGSASSDPDGDPPQYCWSAPGIPETCTPGPAGALFTFQSPLAAGRNVVKLVVRDAEASGKVLSSRPAYSTAWVEAPGLWEGQSGDGASTLERLDGSSFGPITANGGGGVFHRSVPLGADMIVTLTSVSPQLRVFSYPALTGGTPLAAPSGRLRSDPERNRIWVVRGGSSVIGVDIYEPRADLGIDPVSVGVLQATFPGGSFGSPPSVVVGPAGELWLAALYAPLLFSIADPQQAAPAQETIDLTPIDLGTRPARPEMWVMVQEADGVAFRVFSGPGSTAQQIAVEGLAAFGFEWIDENEMWVTTLDGLLRLDANILRAAVEDGLGADAVALATTANVDVLLLARDLVLDEGTGEVWTNGVRIGPDLSVHESGQVPAFIDGDGYPWSTNGGLHRVRTLDSDRTLELATFPENAMLPSVDVVRGSAWVRTGAPVTIQEITSEGRRGQRIAALSLPATGVGLVPAFERLTVEPDGTGAWAVDDGLISTVYRMDFDALPVNAVVAAVMDSGVTGETLYSYAGFHPSAAAAVPFVWTAAYNATELYPVRISDAGVVRDTGVTISSQFGYSMAITRSLVDDAACIATLEEVFVSGTTFNLNVRLFRALPGAAAVLVDQRTFAYTGSGAGSFDYRLPFVSATRSPTGGEMCWTGFVRRANPPTTTSIEQLTVFGAGVGTGTIRSFIYNGIAGEVIRSVSATSPNEVWYLRDTQLANGNPTSSARVRRHTPDGGGVLNGDTPSVSFDHVGDPRVLLGAETESL